MAEILDREFYGMGYEVPPHDLFQPWRGHAAHGEHMRLSQAHAPPNKLYFLYKYLTQSLALASGEVWELGVFTGESSSYLASVSKGRTLRLFDTFEGMPDTDPQYDFHKKGDFSETSLQLVQKRLAFAHSANVEYNQGLVPDTFLGLEDVPIVFAHVDLDIYHPIKACCEFIFPRLPIGGSMIFDDYGWLSCPGARKAVDDYFRWRPEEVISLPTCQAVVTKIRG